MGVGKTVTVSGGTLAGADAGNYQFAAATGTATANITPATLTAAGFTAQNKVYDATTNATVSGGTLGGVLGADVVSLAGLSGSFTDKNVGTGKIVTVSGGTLAGGDAGNYQLTSASGTTTASITPATLTATSFTTQNKVYDATTAATVSGGTLGGVFSGDAVSLTGLSGNFADRNVGTGKTVTVSGGTLAGADAGNYQLSAALATSTADITPAPLTVTANDASRLVGDPNPVFSASYSGLKEADTASVVSGLTIASPATVTSSAGSYPIVPSGGGAFNYVLTYVDGKLTISPAPASAGNAVAATTTQAEQIVVAAVNTSLTGSTSSAVAGATKGALPGTTGTTGLPTLAARGTSATSGSGDEARQDAVQQDLSPAARLAVQAGQVVTVVPLGMPTKTDPTGTTGGGVGEFGGSLAPQPSAGAQPDPQPGGQQQQPGRKPQPQAAGQTQPQRGQRDTKRTFNACRPG